MLRRAGQGCTGMSCVESGGTCDQRVFEFGTTGKWRITILSIALKS